MTNLTSKERAHSKDKLKVVYNEGCGIAFVNEKTGDIDSTTITYFETGVTLSQIYGFLKVLADSRHYILLEGNARKVFQYIEDDLGRSKWFKVDIAPSDDFVFNSKTLYALSAIKNLTHN